MPRAYGRLLGVAIALLAVAGARAQTVTDGDTIRLHGSIWRLWGMDAPETKQTCGDYPAGAAATAALRDLMAGKPISCQHKTNDRYGRLVGICRADDLDLGAAMVRAGHAWAFVRYSRDYVGQEALARADNLGVHAHGCIPAWEWRARRKTNQ